jgi:hypothetical protein
MQHSSLMLVADLLVVCGTVDEAEASAPLITHGDRVVNTIPSLRPSLLQRGVRVTLMKTSEQTY